MKMKLIVILLFIAPIVGFSQINQSIDFVGGIDYSYRNLTTSSDDETIQERLDNLDEKESGKLNWRIGFNYNRKIAKQWFLRTGLRLASVGFKGEKRTDLRWAGEHDGMGGWIPNPSLIHEIQFVNDYWFAEIPIAGRFELNEKKLTSFFELGIAPSIYLTTRTQEITDLGTTTKFSNNNTPELEKVHLVGFIAFGLNYSINDKFQFFGQPTFRYHTTRLIEGQIEEHLLNYGIELGIRRKIK